MTEEQNIPEDQWVRETPFGQWFLSTKTWVRYVLTEAIKDFKYLLGDQVPPVNRILDIGCGHGASLTLLEQYFKPKIIVGADIDNILLNNAESAADLCQCEIQLQHETVNNLSFADESFDMIFCHQLIHHVSNQTTALQELFRVLAAGGVILISESCRPFITSWLVRLLFRHPMESQKTADEYIELIRSIGFQIDDHHIKTSSPWWSSQDFGLLEKMGFPRKKSITEVLLVARKPIVAHY
jgi:ubiquinone/menaquinone biosynthesis C-methylase UbiE